MIFGAKSTPFLFVLALISIFNEFLVFWFNFYDFDRILVFADNGTTGLIISTLIPMTGMLASLMYPMIKLAKAGVSVDRLKEYITYTKFEKAFSHPAAPSPDWPRKGEIKVSNLSIRYRPGLPLVLKGVDFEVSAGEKVAIVGRTGSGKSTTLLALLRILEMAEGRSGNPLGSISIDGMNIAYVGLHELRGKVGIIPQDPYLFEGTLRFNLDPLEDYSDADLIEVLRAVSVIQTIRSSDLIAQRVQELKGKLLAKNEKKLKSEQKSPKNHPKSTKSRDDDVYDSTEETLNLNNDPLIFKIRNEGASDSDKLQFKIESKGANLSIGQRQLICIARALINKPKILLMDEATANIDQRTDSVVQRLIKTRLGETTVVTIAHRLLSIIQYDKVIVLENGEKVEEGAPYDLLEKGEGGIFKGLVEEGGDEFYHRMVRASSDWSIDTAELFSD